jgi:hypothetical protein
MCLLLCFGQNSRFVWVAVMFPELVDGDVANQPRPIILQCCKHRHTRRHKQDGDIPVRKGGHAHNEHFMCVDRPPTDTEDHECYQEENPGDAVHGIRCSSMSARRRQCWWVQHLCEHFERQEHSAHFADSTKEEHCFCTRHPTPIHVRTSSSCTNHTEMMQDHDPVPFLVHELAHKAHRLTCHLESANLQKQLGEQQGGLSGTCCQSHAVPQQLTRFHEVARETHPDTVRVIQHQVYDAIGCVHWLTVGKLLPHDDSEEPCQNKEHRAHADDIRDIQDTEQFQGV